MTGILEAVSEKVSSKISLRNDRSSGTCWCQRGIFWIKLMIFTSSTRFACVVICIRLLNIYCFCVSVNTQLFNLLLPRPRVQNYTLNENKINFSESGSLFLIVELDLRMTKFFCIVSIITVLFAERTVISLNLVQFTSTAYSTLIGRTVHQLFHYNQIPETDDCNLSGTFREKCRSPNMSMTRM